MGECDEIKELLEILITSEEYTFPRVGKVNVSNAQGVYIIINKNNLVFHVGRTYKGEKGLNQRLQNHLNRQTSFSKNYAQPNSLDLRKECKFRYIEVGNGRKRALLEALTTGLLCPEHIGTHE